MVDAADIRRTIVCTANVHKVEELAKLLPELRLEALAAGTPLPPETGTTFLANALIKARAGAKLNPGCWVMADDSGLIVDALDGAPGVYSARFAGEGVTDEANVELLLERIAHVADAERTARFACVLVAVAPDGREFDATGYVEGSISRAPAGAGGFGYDPVFVPVGETHSFAELGADVKAAISHRAHAARELQAQLRVLA